MWIKIIQTSSPEFWYTTEIGSSFFVKDYGDRWMVRKDRAKSLMRFIEKKDAISIDDSRLVDDFHVPDKGEI